MVSCEQVQSNIPPVPYLFFYPDQFLGGNNLYVNFSSMAGIKIATGTGQLQIQRDRDRQIIRGRPTDR